MESIKTEKITKSENKYYVANKKELNHHRLALYHKKKYGIPIEHLDTYLKSRSLYNAIMKEKHNLDIGFIEFLLKKE